MPPRKRARVSQAASPALTKSPEPTKATEDDILNDPWTDEEEIGLFKGLIKWKPTGIHKHFRMLQLHTYLLENNYIHSRNEHTQIAGIWQKLGSLYDLEALDQREDARQLSDLSEDEDQDDEEAEDDAYSLAANKIHNQTFELPHEDYGDQMWKQRFANAATLRHESPPTLPELNITKEAPVKFTPSFSIEPEEVTTPARRPRGRPAKGSAKAKAPVPAAAAAARRSRRQVGSVATESEEPGSVAGSEEQEEEEDADSGGGEDDEENEDDEDEETSQASAPATRGRGARGRGRGTRGRPRGRKRG